MIVCAHHELDTLDRLHLYPASKHWGMCKQIDTNAEEKRINAIRSEEEAKALPRNK